MDLLNIECFDVFDLHDVAVDYETFLFIWPDIRLFSWSLKYRCLLNWMSVVAPFKQNLPHINSTLLRRTHKTVTLAFHKSRVFRPRVSVSGYNTIHPVDSLLISFMTQFYLIVVFYICRFVKDHFLLVYFSKSMFVVIYSLKRHSNSPTLLHVNTLLHILVHKKSMNTTSFYLLWQKGIFI